MLDDRMGPAAVALLGGNFSNASGVWLTVLTTLVQSRHAFRSMRR